MFIVSVHCRGEVRHREKAQGAFRLEVVDLGHRCGVSCVGRWDHVLTLRVSHPNPVLDVSTVRYAEPISIGLGIPSGWWVGEKRRTEVRV